MFIHVSMEESHSRLLGGVSSSIQLSTQWLQALTAEELAKVARRPQAISEDSF